MRRFLTACIVAICSIPGVLRAAELKDERLFALNFGENASWEFGKSTSVEIPGIFALNPQTDIARSDFAKEPAKPLSPSAVRLLENTRSGGLSGAFSVMPLGKTDQAVSFEAKGRVPATAGAITFWFRGQAWDYTPTTDKNKDIPKRVNVRAWDVATLLRETFFEFRAAGGKATFGKLEPGKLVLEAGAAKVSAAIDFDVSLVHLLAVNYSDGKAQIYVDGVLKGEGAFAMPAEVQEMVVGQIGPGGETWNRWLDDFAVWKRPLKVSEMMILRRKEGAVQLPLQTTIPKARNAPVIDGLMKEGEWDQAAAVTGMQSVILGGGYEVYADGGDLGDYKDRIFLSYDDQNLYVAYHCPPPREIKGDAAMTAAMLKRGISVFDANVDSDDAFQICVQYPKPGGDLYNLFVNGINTHYDFNYGGFAEGSRLPLGCKLAWDPKWRTASTLDTDGWHLEMAIPLDSFDIPAPKPGDIWYINFMRWWQTIRSGIQSWAWGNRTMDEEGNERASAPGGRMVFGAPGVILRQNGIGEIAQGRVEISADLVNTDAKDRTVTCLLETNSGELADEKAFTIPAGGKATYEFKNRMIQELTATVVLKVLDENKKPIALAGYPVQRPTEAEIYVRKYPSFDLVKYEINFTDLAKYEAGALALDLTVQNEAGATVWQKHYGQFKDYNLVAEIGTKEFANGAYTVTFVFKGPEGKELEKAVQTFAKKPFPEWYGNKLGYEDEKGWAPHPWTNVEVKDERVVNLWGRTYDFADTLYPQAVSTQGKSVLRAPMGIALETSEGKLAADAKVTGAEWTKKTPCRVEGVRKAVLGNLAVENNFWIEYDGLVWTTLKLIPTGSVQVKSLAFEIPFNKEFSDVINANDYSMRYTGKFKPEGYVGSAHATWLGNAYGGIQWDIETVGPFEVKDPNTCVRVIATPEGGTMRIEIINKDTTLSKPREISFGFIATPARPNTLRTTDGARFRRYVNIVGRWQDPEPIWRPFHQHWLNPGAVQQGRIHSPAFPGVEARPVHHTTLCMMAGVDEAMQEFGDEWLLDETIRWRNSPEAKRATRVTTNSKTLVDYTVWRFNEYFKREPMAGGYFDVSMPEYSANPYAGAGYVRDDGTRESQMNLMGHRMVAKRIYNIQNSVFPGGGLWWHASEGPRLIYMSYCIGDYDGENGNSVINGDNPTYRNMLTPDNYRAQYMGSNWGQWNAFLSQGRIKKETLEKFGFSELWDQWTGLQWLHDCYVGTGWFSNVGHLEGLLAQRDLLPFNQYNLFSPFNRFIGYWEQSVTKLDKPEFYASFYIKEPLKPVPHYGLGALPYYSTYDTGLDGVHQAALVFYNHGMYEGEVRLTLDWKQLGFDDVMQVKAINAVHSTGFRVPDWTKPIPELAGELYDKSAAEFAKIENGQIVFPITQFNYRLIILQAPKPWVGLKEVKPGK